MQAKSQVGPGIIMIIVSLIILSQAIVMEKAPILDPTAGSFLPALISIIMLISGVTLLFPKKQQGHDDPDDEGRDDETFTLKDYRFIFIFFLLIVVYVVLLSIISFFPATFIFLLASMFYLKNVSWKTNLLVSLGSVIVIYFLFQQLFKIIFP